MLSENGLDPNHDQVYLRFLFRLGDRRTNDQSLFELFERLLDEAGIRIEFNSDDDEVQDVNVTRNLTGHGNQEDVGLKEVFPSTRRNRRASFQSVYDAGDEDTRFYVYPGRPTRLASRALFRESLANESHPLLQYPNQLHDKALSDPPTPAQRVSSARGRTFGLSGSSQSHRYHSPDLNKREQFNIQTREKSAVSGFHVESRRPQVSSQLELESNHTHLSPERNAFVLKDRERFYDPSATQLLRDAETFQNYRVYGVAVNVLHKWSDAAKQEHQRHRDNSRSAFARDRAVLSRQAFELWRLRLCEKKQTAEVHKYFDRLEKRAVGARDLYILAKAFSHWSHCAEDEAMKVTLARRHVLSLKYFHAWKEIAVETRHKVHFHALQKSLDVWKQQFSRFITYEIKADLARQRWLMKAFYWKWFWSFCEQRAPEWYTQRLRKIHFAKWIFSFRSSRERNVQVSVGIERAAKKNFLLNWLDKTKTSLSAWDLAHTLDQQRLLTSSLQNWTRTRIHQPLLQQVSNLVDWRVAGFAFTTLVNRYRLEGQGQKISRLRLLHDVWTQWNDRLRWQTLARRIDDRRMLEALYRWTLAQRRVLLERLFTQRLQKQYLMKVNMEWRNREGQRTVLSDNFTLQRNKSSAVEIFTRWRSRLYHVCQSEQVAAEFLDPKVKRNLLHVVSQRAQQMQTLRIVANDTLFYYATKRCLDRWHLQLVESRRQRRRSGYIQMRRKVKMNLASRILQQWRSSMITQLAQIDEARSFNYNHELKFGAGLFDLWKNLHDLSIEQAFQADGHHGVLLLRRTLQVWRDRRVFSVDLERTAVIQRDLSVQDLAATCVNQMRLKIIELKGPIATAENLRFRYQRRHFHNCFRRWQDLLTLRTQGPQSRRPISVKSRKKWLSPPGNNRPVQSRHNETRTEWESTPSPITQSQARRTILPGQLSTPSKRAARAVALVQDATTPTATPHNRLLAQLTLTPQTTSRALFRRSIALRSKAQIHAEHQLEEEAETERI